MTDLSPIHPDPAADPLSVGATIIDCGEHATVTGVETDGDAVAYEIEWEDGESGRIGGDEVELGVIDGTIRVVR